MRPILLMMFLLGPQGIVLADDSRPLALGRIVSKGTLVDRLEVPSGTTLFENTEIRSRTLPARIHLESGYILELAPNSKILIAAAAPDHLKATVVSGILHYQNSLGLATSAAAEEEVMIPLHRKAFPDRKTAGVATAALLRWKTALMMASGVIAKSLGVLVEPPDHPEASPSVPSDR